MGKKVDPEKYIFISFEEKAGDFVGFLPIEVAGEPTKDPEILISGATKLYKRYVTKMREKIADIKDVRKSGQLLPARYIWELGDLIFELKRELSAIYVQVNGFYNHLVRDLGVKLKWLEKVVTFRRYIKNVEKIPEGLNWGRCEKGTKKVAERLVRGLPPK